MKSAFRNAFCSLSRSLNPNPKNLSASISPSLPFIAITTISLPLSARTQTQSHRSFCSSSSPLSMADSSSLSLESQFKEFRTQLEESGTLREKIKTVVSDIESATRIMQACLLLVHQSRPLSDILEEAKGQIGVLKELYGKLAEIMRECPGQYYRYHVDWRSETQTAVSLLVFMHWLETGTLLLHSEAEEKLGLNSSEFGLDVEDYLVGVCLTSNEMPRYVVNRVTAGDYDCPRKVLKFLTDLHAGFRMLNLRNDLLRRKFDGMKYDVRRVEEVYYDVKIRGLAVNGDASADQAVKG